jgi:hypothetical protein
MGILGKLSKCHSVLTPVFLPGQFRERQTPPHEQRLHGEEQITGIAHIEPGDDSGENLLQYFRCVHGGVSSRLVVTGNKKPRRARRFCRRLRPNLLKDQGKMWGDLRL